MRILGLQHPPGFDEIADTSLEIFHRERLFDKSIHTAIHAFRLAVIIRFSSQHNERYMAGSRILTHLRAQFHTVHLWHHPITHNQRNLLFFQHLQCHDTIISGKDTILVLEMGNNVFTEFQIIFHNEHGWLVCSLLIFLLLSHGISSHLKWLDRLERSIHFRQKGFRLDISILLRQAGLHLIDKIGQTHRITLHHIEGRIYLFCIKTLILKRFPLVSDTFHGSDYQRQRSTDIAKYSCEIF